MLAKNYFSFVLQCMMAYTQLFTADYKYDNCASEIVNQKLKWWTDGSICKRLCKEILSFTFPFLSHSSLSYINLFTAHNRVKISTALVSRFHKRWQTFPKLLTAIDAILANGKHYWIINGKKKWQYRSLSNTRFHTSPQNKTAYP